MWPIENKKSDRRDFGVLSSHWDHLEISSTSITCSLSFEEANLRSAITPLVCQVKSEKTSPDLTPSSDTEFWYGKIGEILIVQAPSQTSTIPVAQINKS